MTQRNILVTGCAGFIGFHVVKKLIKKNINVIGIDNINSYYSTKLKKDRLLVLEKFKNFKFHKIDLTNKKKLEHLVVKYKINYIVNLAAQAGVRYSIKNPFAYLKSNLIGFTNILEVARNNNVRHLVYASSSSVYGASKRQPYIEKDLAAHPLAFYGATKRSNELMAHAYSHLYNLPTTGLRFFTVYGPWGRPDMALFKFTKAIIEGKTIEVFNHGKHTRDFTYIDDIVDGVIKTLDHQASSNIDWNSDHPDPASSNAPWRIYNIGNNKPVELMDYIDALEKTLGKKAKINYLPLQPGDVPDTYADTDNLNKKFNYKPSTSVIEGVSKFVKWYMDYYSL